MQADGQLSFLKDILLVFAGWLLATLTAVLERRRASSESERALFGRIHMILEDILIGLATTEVFAKAGITESVDDLFAEADSSKPGLPPEPPPFPNDLPQIIERSLEYDASHPKSRVSDALFVVRERFVRIHQIWARIRNTVNEGGTPPERAMQAYHGERHSLRDFIRPIIERLETQRTHPLLRPLRRFRRRKNERSG